MPYARIDDRLYDNPKAEQTSANALGHLLLTLSYVGRHMTDGALPSRFVARHLRSRRGGKRAVDELLARGWLHEAGALCDRCVATLRKVGTAPPGEGYYVHDYLVHNASRTQIESTRGSDTRRQALHRDKATVQFVRQRDDNHCRYCNDAVDWRDRRSAKGGTYDHVDPLGSNAPDNVVVACRGCNSRKGSRTPDEAGMPLLPAGGAQLGFTPDLNPNQNDFCARVDRRGGSTTATETEAEAIDARALEVVSILSAAPRFAVSAPESIAGVSAAIRGYGSADPISAAHAAVAKAHDPDFKLTSPVHVFALALREQAAGSSTQRGRRQSPSDLLRALNGDAA